MGTSREAAEWETAQQGWLGPPPAKLELPARTGLRGVAAIPGFVLAWAAGPITVSQFYRRWFARVYPAYFAAIWIWLAVACPLVVAPTAAVACAVSAAGSRVDLAAFANPGVRVGEISFAFYLLHPAALTIGGDLGWYGATTAPGEGLALLAGFGLSLALAAALHHAVEGPARRAAP